MKRFLLPFVLLLLLIACAPGPAADGEAGAGADNAAVTTFFLSRHAEKTSGDNPGLLPAGEARAERIARKLGKEKIAAVYATGYQRTQATAAPVAKAAGLSVKTYDAGQSAASFTKELLMKHRGQTVFIVGHSNTIPNLVNALVGGKRYGDIAEDDYNRLFKVTVGADGKGKVTELSSGK